MMHPSFQASPCRLETLERQAMPTGAAATAVVRDLAGVTVIEERLPIGDGSGETTRQLERAARVAVVYIQSGRLYGRVGPHEVAAAPGGLLLWHTELPASFRIAAPVRSFTFLFTEQELAWRGSIGCRAIHREDPLGTVIASFFEGLTARLDALSAQQAESAIAMTRDVVNRALSMASSARLREATDAVVERIFEQIERELSSPALRPGSLAKAHGISIRYLHLLFSRRGLRVATWIRERRLEACRAELATAPEDITISSIAQRWGFTDASHFSRLFSSAYGVSPLGYRRQHRRPS